MSSKLIVPQTTSIAILGNEIDAETDIAEKLRLLLSQKDAFSPKTFEKILIVMKSWTDWCKDNNALQLPVQPEDFRRYARYLHEVRNLASTSIDSHKTILNIVHRHIGLQPLSADLSVSRELAIIRRRSIMSGEKTGQAIPLRMDDLLELKPLWKDSPRIADVRNLAALYMSYNTMLRIAELSRVKVCHLRPQHDGSMLVDVPYTKTVLNTVGLVKILSKASTEILMTWLDRSGLIDKPDAYVLCPVHRTNKVYRFDATMTHPATNQIFTDAWRALGREDLPTNKGRYARWTGHSCRVGAAQDLMLSGASLAMIMQEGTWKDPKMVMQYLRNLEAHNSQLKGFMDDKSDPKHCS